MSLIPGMTLDHESWPATLTICTVASSESTCSVRMRLKSVPEHGMRSLVTTRRAWEVLTLMKSQGVKCSLRKDLIESYE